MRVSTYEATRGLIDPLAGGRKALFAAQRLLKLLGGLSPHISEDLGVPLIFDLAPLTIARNTPP